ncbi:MAG: hypothetical protein AVDCRST_MAG02-3318, partial [uncultured Rubrobacteraceae bacterium]
DTLVGECSRGLDDAHEPETEHRAPDAQERRCL